jgi:hypothetical protein
MLCYIKNVSTDANLQLNDGTTDTYPIFWLWEKLGGVAETEDTTYKYLWIAASLLT